MTNYEAARMLRLVIAYKDLTKSIKEVIRYYVVTQVQEQKPNQAAKFIDDLFHDYIDDDYRHFITIDGEQLVFDLDRISLSEIDSEIAILNSIIESLEIESHASKA